MRKRKGGGIRIRRTVWALAWHPKITFKALYQEGSLRKGWLAYGVLLSVMWLGLVASLWAFILFATYHGDRAFAQDVTPHIREYGVSFLGLEGLGFIWLWIATLVYSGFLRAFGGHFSLKRMATIYAWAYSGGAFLTILIGLFIVPVIVGLVLHNEGASFLGVLFLSILYSLIMVGIGILYSFWVARIATPLSGIRILGAVILAFGTSLVLMRSLLRYWPLLRQWLVTYLFS